jgi:DNA polymerase delta subunit 1
MVDHDIVGCCWVELPPKKYRIITCDRETNCQIEASAKLENLIVHQPTEDPYDGIAPLRVLSFDIECAADPGVFPTPDKNPIIQIACICKEQGSMEPCAKICFNLGSCSPVRGAEIVECADEATLLKRWADFVREIDPDILTGYNIQNFDIPYIMDRAKVLKVGDYVSTISRILYAKCRIRSATFSSAQMGTRTNKIIDLDGRIIFDVFQVVMRDYKLRSYTLNNVSYHFLNEQKEDVEHNMISVLFVSFKLL